MKTCLVTTTIRRNFTAHVKMKNMIRVSLVIQNHLNELMYETDANTKMWRLKFIKALVHIYPDTNVRVDDSVIDAIWKENEPK